MPLPDRRRATALPQDWQDVDPAAAAVAPPPPTYGRITAHLRSWTGLYHHSNGIFDFLKIYRNMRRRLLLGHGGLAPVIIEHSRRTRNFHQQEVTVQPTSCETGRETAQHGAITPAPPTCGYIKAYLPDPTALHNYSNHICQVLQLYRAIRGGAFSSATAGAHMSPSSRYRETCVPRGRGSIDRAAGTIARAPPTSTHIFTHLFKLYGTIIIRA